MFDFIPDPIAFQIGSIPIYWYGVGYALGLAAAFVVLVREARRHGQNPDHVGNAIIIVAIAALIGGRLYHVIDQWPLYQNDPLKIVLPPYTGLGVYGGILTGTLAVVAYTRLNRLPFWTWADIIAPALFVMQAVARWGNFFNQELYGSPTDLPWGIPIECDHRLLAYPCELFPFEATRFHPLFLYESLSGLLGAIVLLWLGRRFAGRQRPGDLFGLFLVWYGVVRFALESFRSENWLFFGVPTAQVFSAAAIIAGLLIILIRHRRPGPSAAEFDAEWRAASEADAGEADAAKADEAEGFEESEVSATESDATEAPGPEEEAVDEDPDRPDPPAEDRPPLT